MPYRERGARTDEYLAAMRAIWSEETPAYHGRYVSFQGVQAYPHPVQQPAPPIVMGGRASAVLRRTVEQADGWYGFANDLDALWDQNRYQQMDFSFQAEKQVIREVLILR